MPSPPKPWEVNSGSAIASTPVVTQSTSLNNSMTDTTTTSSVPTVPNRPSTMSTMGTMGGMGGTMGTMGTMGSSYGGRTI